MKRKILLPILTLFIGIVMGSIFLGKSLLAPVNPKSSSTQIFVVAKGESLKSIAQRLEKEKLIKNWLAFTFLVKKMGIEKSIQAGDFRLSSSSSSAQIAKDLTHGTLDVWVTIPEGWRNEEIIEELYKSGVWQKGAVRPDLLEGRVLFDKYNGKLFPDTYLIPKNALPSQVVEIFLNNFNSKVTTEMWQAGRKNGLKEEEALILASIVEREAKFDKDRPIVAGILIKRYKNDWALEADATIQYVLGYQESDKTWWKRHLTAQDLKIDSAYNTRRFKGLPPTSIANPGLFSLKAVFYPEDSPYWFYLSDTKGQMHYGKTIEEHLENIRKYLQ